MDVSDFPEAIEKVAGSTNTLLNTFKTLRELVSKPDFANKAVKQRVVGLTDAMVDFNQKLLILQAHHSKALAANEALRKKVAKYKKKMAKLNEFETEKGQYERRTIGPDTTAMVRKSASQSGQEPAMLLCEHCFNRSIKAVLQFKEYAPKTNVLHCHRCGADFHKATDREYGVRAAPRSDNSLSGYRLR